MDVEARGSPLLGLTEVESVEIFFRDIALSISVCKSVDRPLTLAFPP